MIKSLTLNKMAARVFNRDDNVYSQKVIRDILKMFTEETQRALLRGEKVQIKGICTLVPRIHVKESYTLPSCNRPEGNQPYTEIKISRWPTNKSKMDRQLRKNIKNGIYGLQKTTFDFCQMRILKETGYIPKDARAQEEYFDEDFDDEELDFDDMDLDNAEDDDMDINDIENDDTENDEGAL